MSIQSTSTEVRELFEILTELGRSPSSPKSAWYTPASISLIVMIGFLILAVIADRFGYLDATLVLVALFLVTPVISMMIALGQILHGLRPFLRAPTKHMLNQATSRVGLKYDAIHRLQRFSTDTLVSAQHALAAEIEGFEERTSLLVGLLEKTGMIPAALALYLGYVQYRKNGTANDNVDLFFLLAFVLYAIAFFGLAWKQTLKDKLWLLQQLNSLD